MRLGLLNDCTLWGSLFGRWCFLMISCLHLLQQLFICFGREQCKSNSFYAFVHAAIIAELCRLQKHFVTPLFLRPMGTLAKARGLCLYWLKYFWSKWHDLHENHRHAIHVQLGPKIRVPRGVLSSRMITAAHFSSRFDVWTIFTTSSPDLVRTITAFATSPFLTAPPGSSLFYWCNDCITDARGIYVLNHQELLIVKISRAPLLSATFKRVSVWIIYVFSFQVWLDDDRFFNDFYKTEAFCRLKADGVSMIRTISPSLAASLFSSWGFV